MKHTLHTIMHWILILLVLVFGYMAYQNTNTIKDLQKINIELQKQVSLNLHNIGVIVESLQTESKTDTTQIPTSDQ